MANGEISLFELSAAEKSESVYKCERVKSEFQIHITREILWGKYQFIFSFV